MEHIQHFTKARSHSASELVPFLLPALYLDSIAFEVYLVTERYYTAHLNDHCTSRIYGRNQ